MQIPEHIQQSAATSFKNYVKTGWALDEGSECILQNGDGVSPRDTRRTTSTCALLPSPLRRARALGECDMSARAPCAGDQVTVELQPIPDSDREQIRTNIISLMLQLTDVRLQKLLSDALSLVREPTKHTAEAPQQES